MFTYVYPFPQGCINWNRSRLLMTNVIVLTGPPGLVAKDNFLPRLATRIEWAPGPSRWKLTWNLKPTYIVIKKMKYFNAKQRRHKNYHKLDLPRCSCAVPSFRFAMFCSCPWKWGNDQRCLKGIAWRLRPGAGEKNSNHETHRIYSIVFFMQHLNYKTYSQLPYLTVEWGPSFFRVNKKKKQHTVLEPTCEVSSSRGANVETSHYGAPNVGPPGFEAVMWWLWSNAINIMGKKARNMIFKGKIHSHISV